MRGPTDLELAAAYDEIEGPLAAPVVSGEAPRTGGIDGLGEPDVGQWLTVLRREHETQGSLADALRDGVRHVERDHHRGTDLLVGQRGEVRGEPVDRAAMPDAAAPVQLTDREADAEAGPLAGRRVLRRPHRLERLLLQHPAVLALPAGEERAQEATEIEHARVHAAGRGHAELEVRRLVVTAVPRPHVGSREALLDVRRPLECRVLDAGP